MKRIYAIRVQSHDEWGSKNSDEAYTSLQKAQEFVESRGDNPRPVCGNPCFYEGTEYKNFIDELILKE